MSRLFVCGAAIALAAMVFAGCKAPGDTSGFKPAPVADKGELQKEIAEVTASSKIPPGIKAMALKDLQAKLATAK